MGKAVRAIITDGDKLLIMHRNKHGSEYFTLPGGRVNEGESLEETLLREIKEETNLDVTAAQLVFYEKHPPPHNEQYIYLCEVAPNGVAALQADSEEATLNRTVVNIHTLGWINSRSLAAVQFRTPQLHKALIDGLENGFPDKPVQL